MAGHWEEDYDAAQERADCYAFLTGVHAGERPGEWIGDVPDHWGDTMFGGSIIGQSVTALTRDMPEEPPHAFVARLLRAADERRRADRVRDRLDPRRPQLLDAAVHRQPARQDDLRGHRVVHRRHRRLPLRPAAHESAAATRGRRGRHGPGGMEASYFGWTEQRADGTYESTDRKWFRMPSDIGDDVHLHTAYLGFASDWTGIGSRPRLLSWDNDEYGIASLDHAVWFHRPARITDWHFYDLHALVNFGGRSQVRATIRNEAGEVVVSMAQELLVRVL